MNHEFYIRRTFELARLGLGKTWPNPLVGALIVKEGRILAEGYHHQHGGAHAEADAFNNCQESPAGATVYVNLEPCCHTNKLTPPCAQRLIQEKVKKVVICNLDPNPAVNGKGVELLRSHGIEVEHGILAEEGEELNEVFFHAQRTRLPFVHLKLATTLDGKIALSNGESQWITGEKARQDVHRMRSHSQGIMVGAETIRQDNPKLNVRLPDYQGKQPTRIVFTRSNNLPKEAQIFTDGGQTIVYSQGSLQEAMQDLFEKKYISLMLEGGACLASEFIRCGLVNRVSLYLNPSFLGSGKSALHDLGITQLNQRPFLKNMTTRLIENDLLISGRI